MAIPEPPATFGLWPAVKARIGGWIESDEEAVRALGEQWTNAAAAFEGVWSGGSASGAPASVLAPGSWTDQAGRLWQGQILSIGRGLNARETEMRQLAAHAEAFAQDVIHAKRSIVQAIEDNLDAYGRLVTMPEGVDVAAQERFVSEIARAINTFLDDMAAQIAARKPAITAQAAQAQVDVDKGALDGFGIDDLADAAGIVSSLASAGALIFPPAAVALAPIALVTGAFALGVHAVEAFQDPNGANLVTLAGDVLAVAPGAGVISAGGKTAGGVLNALSDAASVPAQGWVDVATGLNAGRYADQVATGLQAGSNALPQVPAAVDMLNPGDQTELDGAQSAAGSAYTAGRVIDVLPRLR